MNKVPSIRRVIPKENYILEIHFQNEEMRAYRSEEHTSELQ